MHASCISKMFKTKETIRGHVGHVNRKKGNIIYDKGCYWYNAQVGYTYLPVNIKDDLRYPPW